ncbi:MAG: Ig-like domain-containing protein [Lachnospiraceae bacterium]|nr:Ig-like domain-containing protein [Lachnospiraceae bacterium]
MVGDSTWDSTSDSRLTIAKGATVKAVVNAPQKDHRGIAVYSSKGLDVSGTLIADGGNGGQSFGVQTSGDVDVSGTLIATAGSSVVESYGIYTYKNVTVREGGVVEASAIGNASAEMCKGVGIYTWTAWDESAHSKVDGKVIIEGGEVTASGYDCGIQSRDSVIIKGGKVTATAEEGNGIRCGVRNWDTGIYENGTIRFEGGSVTASGSDKGVYAQNVSISDGLTAMAGDEAPGADVTNTFATNHDQKWVKVEPPKIPQDITAPDVTVTYGDTDKSVSASVTYPTEGGGAISYAVKDGSKDYIDVDATTGALTIKKVPADGKAYVIVTSEETSTYAQATREVTVTINKVSAVTATVTANSRTYDGMDKPLVNVDESTLVGGEMYYATGDANGATEPYNTSIPTATNVGTYYVWYKAVGTDGHADSAVACVTVTISEPSSGGGGGGYTIEPTTETAPSTPTETYTIPVENESSVNVQADIQNGNAKVTEITEEDIHKVTEGSSGEDSQGKTVDNNTILIDLSGATQEVKSVELSKTTMERLAETATSTENKIETVTVQLTNVTVELDAKTLSAVTQQAEGNSINLVVEDTNASTLNSDQQQALSEFTSASTFEAYFESAGSRIHDFRGGEATVSMKFTPAQGLSITHYHVYYVATSGKLERFVTRFIKTLIKAEKSDKKGASEGEGILQFTTTHFSDYAIVYDETMKNATGREEADDTSSREDKTKTANGKSSYENGLSINKGLKVSQKGETIQISWGKVKGADGYDVYVQYCGKAFSSKPVMSVNREVTSVTIKKINGKKLNLKKNYKIFVVAYKNVEGKKKRLAKSIVAHIVGAKNTRYSNPKELTITSDTDVTLEKGKTSKIKARVILANAKRKSLSDAHAPMFRYASSDKKIATVDKKGKITAKKQGSCLIWVYAKNGYAKKVKVTVK